MSPSWAAPSCTASMSLQSHPRRPGERHSAWVLVLPCRCKLRSSYSCRELLAAHTCGRDGQPCTGHCQDPQKADPAEGATSDLDLGLLELMFPQDTQSNTTRFFHRATHHTHVHSNKQKRLGIQFHCRHPSANPNGFHILGRIGL